jgi:hypothetical protein
MAVDETGGAEEELGMEERDPNAPQEKIDQATADSNPSGFPDLADEGPQKGADVGPGQKKGQGPPPGSVGKDEDTPQTPTN